MTKNEAKTCDLIIEECNKRLDLGDAIHQINKRRKDIARRLLKAKNYHDQALGRTFQTMLYVSYSK